MGTNVLLKEYWLSKAGIKSAFGAKKKPDFLI
jgi:hypothetical protein